MDELLVSNVDYTNPHGRYVHPDELAFAKEHYLSSQHYGVVSFKDFLDTVWFKIEQPSEETKDVNLVKECNTQTQLNVSCSHQEPPKDCDKPRCMHDTDPKESAPKTVTKQIIIQESKKSQVSSKENNTPIAQHSNAKTKMSKSIMNASSKEDIPIIESKNPKVIANANKSQKNIFASVESPPVLQSKSIAAPLEKDALQFIKHINEIPVLHSKKNALESMPIGAAQPAKNIESKIKPKRTKLAESLYNLAQQVKDYTPMELQNLGYELGRQILVDKNIGNNKTLSTQTQLLVAIVYVLDEIGQIWNDELASQARKSLSTVISKLSSLPTVQKSESIGISIPSFKSIETLTTETADRFSQFVAVLIIAQINIGDPITEYVPPQGRALARKFLKRSNIRGFTPQKSFDSNDLKTLIAIYNILLGVCQYIFGIPHMGDAVLYHLSEISDHTLLPDGTQTQTASIKKEKPKKSFWDKFRRSKKSSDTYRAFTMGLVCAANQLIEEKLNDGSISPSQIDTVSLFIPDRNAIGSEICNHLCLDENRLVEAAKHHMFMGTFEKSQFKRLSSAAGNTIQLNPMDGKIHCYDNTTIEITKTSNEIPVNDKIKVQLYYINEILG